MTLLKVLGFSLALTLLFTLVANVLPQVEGEAPVEETVDLASLDLDTFISIGETIFNGKGTCTLCHNNMGRAPDLLAMDMTATSIERLADPRYAGEATDAENYLRESMVAPDLYVVTGFGKKGSNDSASPMPDVRAAPIQLDSVEIEAIIAYLQAKDGNQVTVALPRGGDVEAVAEAEPQAAATPTTAGTAEEVLAKYACTACHTIGNTMSSLGPDLTTVGQRLSREQIRQSIVDPAAQIAEGFPPMMPTTFVEQMMVKELELLVDFLAHP